RRAPATASEETLVRIVGELLGTEVGPDDSFFEVGGDSIGAMQLVSRARAAGLAFTARDVIEQRTVAALARRADSSGDAVVAVGDRSGRAPLTPVIEKMLDRGGDVRRFVMPMVFTVPADVTADTIARTIGVVVDHHDVLRSTFDPAGRALTIAAPGTVDVAATLTRVDLAADEVPGTDGYTARLRASVADAVDRMDPEAGVMMQLVWLAPGTGGTGRLAVVLHHLVVDAVSWQILQSDIAVAGSQVSSGQEPFLPDAGTSWLTWSAAVRDAAAGRRGELDHWVRTLDVDDPDLGSRRLDVAADRQDRLARFELEIPAEVVEPLLASAGGSSHLEGESVADMLVAGLAAAVVGWRRDRGVDAPGALFTLEGHGRQEGAVGEPVDLSRTVGWFTSMFPTYVDLGGRTAVDMLDAPAVAAEVVAATREAMAAHPDRGIGYGMLRYLDPEGRHRLGGFAEPQIVFNYIGSVPGADVADDIGEVPWFPDVAGPEVVDVTDPEALARGNRMPAQAEIDIQSMSTVTAQGRVVRAMVTYLDEAIDREDLQELVDHWTLALRAIADRTR
ncbi:MAG: hypothetical protein INR72_17660, partial [Williamsia herbipolensis]|nr:hypothetical protein [Williamsia herbipolensis]